VFLPDEIIRESGIKTFSWVLLRPYVDEVDARLDAEGTEDEMSPIALRVWPTPESIQGTASAASAYTVMLTNDGFLSNRMSQFGGDNALLLGGGTSSTSTVSLEPMLKDEAQNGEDDDVSLNKTVTRLIVPVAKRVVLKVERSDKIDDVTFGTNRFVKTWKSWFRNRLVTKGNKFQIRFYGEVVGFGVLEVDFLGVGGGDGSIEESLEKLSIKGKRRKYRFAEITDETEVVVEMNDEGLVGQMERYRQEERLVTLKDVGGLDSVVKEICSTINFIFNADIDGNFDKVICR
jgi:hypothetical protein